MKASRRGFIAGALGAGAVGLRPAHGAQATRPATPASAQSRPAFRDLDRAASGRCSKLDGFTSPVIIDSMRLLKKGDEYFVHVRSKDGAEGVSVTNPPRAEYLDKILKQLVLPFFVGKDARDLENLLWELYRWKDNYKLYGLALWSPQAWVEFAILDMLGRIARKPMGALLGDIVRKEVAFYVASGRRDTTPEAGGGLPATAAGAVGRAGGEVPRRRPHEPQRRRQPGPHREADPAGAQELWATRSTSTPTPTAPTIRRRPSRWAACWRR